MGVVSAGIPFSLHKIGSEWFITQSVGRSFHIYDCQHLHLKHVSKVHPGCISGCVTVVVDGFPVNIVSEGSKVHLWNSRRHIGEIDVESPIRFLIGFGTSIVAVCGSNEIAVFDITLESIELRHKFSAVNSHGDTITCITHPPTYVNKIVIGYVSGNVELWNISSMKMIYRFSIKTVENSESIPGVTCLASASVLDVIAVGFSNGFVAVHNTRADKSILRIQIEDSVSGLSFRSDGHSMLAVGSSKGSMFLWDLEKRLLKSEIKTCHMGAIVSPQFVYGEPILITTGIDNSLKMWIFDLPNGNARLLRFREGHSKPPSLIRFLEDGKYLVSAGDDCSVRLFSIYRDEVSREMGQTVIRRKGEPRSKKLSKTLDLCYSGSKRMDWDSLITCHEGHKFAHLWNIEKLSLGSIRLQPPDLSAPKCVFTSHCGNFAIVGTVSGSMHKFSMQSGQLRTTFETSGGIALICVGCDNRTKFLYLYLLTAVYHSSIVYQEKRFV